jgi:KaiC/GvpD/RAD55 family RecA-like ATPase
VRVPEPLRQLHAWLVWRFEQFDGEVKPRKMPYWADGGKRHGEQGGATDRARLVTFEEAREAAIRGNYAGIGFAPLPELGLTFLDFDNCVDAQGRIPPEIMAIVGRTYAEYSPSGKGIRAVLKGDLGNRKSHGEPYGVELFSSKGYVTLTGNILPECDLLGGPDHIAEINDATRAFVEARFGAHAGTVDPDNFMLGREPRLGLSIAEMEDLLSYLDPSMGRDPWLKVGLALHHETGGDDTGFELWDTWSSDGDTYPGDEQLRSQWDRFEQRAGRASVTMATVKWMAKEAGYGKELTAEQVLALADDLQASTDTSRFALLSYNEVMARNPGEWIIKGVLPKGELGILFGASGSGKSFVALDMACAIVRGVAWRGKRVRQGKVVIIAAEGGAGIRQRLKAYAAHHGLTAAELADIRIVLAAPNFLEQDDIAEVIAEIRKFGDVSTIIIDTLAQVTPGANENASEDMGRALANVKLLHRATGAMPLVVHHAGKDLSKGSRGWSGLKAAADVQIEVLRHEDGHREIVIEKMKDGEDGLRWPFKLEVVDLGFDSDGDPISSCVAIETDAPARQDAELSKAVKRRGRIESHILEVMYTFGEVDTVSALELIERATAMLPEPEEGKRDTRRQTVARALHNLSREKDGPLQLAGGRVIFFE